MQSGEILKTQQKLKNPKSFLIKTIKLFRKISKASFEIFTFEISPMQRKSIFHPNSTFTTHNSSAFGSHSTRTNNPIAGSSSSSAPFVSVSSSNNNNNNNINSIKIDRPRRAQRRVNSSDKDDVFGRALRNLKSNNGNIGEEDEAAVGSSGGSNFVGGANTITKTIGLLINGTRETSRTYVGSETRKINLVRPPPPRNCRKSDADLFADEDDVDLESEEKVKERIEKLEREISSIGIKKVEYGIKNKELIINEASHQKEMKEKYAKTRAVGLKWSDKAERITKEWRKAVEDNTVYGPFFESFGINVGKHGPPTCKEGKLCLPSEDNPSLEVCDVWNCPALQNAISPKISSLSQSRMESQGNK